jgi:hypothetical protein
MATRSRKQQDPPPEDVDLARRLVVKLGDRKAAERLHIGRTSVCRLAAGLPVTAGTLALVREARAEAGVKLK